MARQRVLVVEDDPHDREIYGKLLWYNGFDVLFARDGEEGLRFARQHRPDLVLLDMVMPGLDGITLCALLKKDARTAHIPVLALSGLARDEMEDLAQEVGCMSYLEKPISPVAVLHEIEAVIGKAPPASPEADRSETSKAGPLDGVAAD